MLHAFRDLLCSKLCWHNGPGLNQSYVITLLHFVKAIVFHWLTAVAIITRNNEQLLNDGGYTILGQLQIITSAENSKQQ